MSKYIVHECTHSQLTCFGFCSQQRRGMGGCCAALTGMSQLPPEYRAPAAAPANTSYCRRLRIGYRSGFAEFHLTWVGADHRGMYISILGDSALVPWSNINLRDVLDARWVHLNVAFMNVRLQPAVFCTIVEPHMPLNEHSLHDGHDRHESYLISSDG